MQEQAFDANIKSAQIKGEYKLDSNNNIVAEPEVLIVLRLPLDADTPAFMEFIARAKRAGGQVSATLVAAQMSFDFSGNGAKAGATA